MPRLNNTVINKIRIILAATLITMLVIVVEGRFRQLRGSVIGVWTSIIAIAVGRVKLKEQSIR